MDFDSEQIVCVDDDFDSLHTFHINFNVSFSLARIFIIAIEGENISNSMMSTLVKHSLHQRKIIFIEKIVDGHGFGLHRSVRHRVVSQRI